MAKPLNQTSGMPQMRAAFSGWFTQITLQKITESIVDGFVQNVVQDITFTGTIQPLSAEEIALKPDGQRSFEWLQIHALTGTNNLVTNDRIVYNGRKFKVMAVKDYSLNNYIEYHAIQDFQDE